MSSSSKQVLKKRKLMEIQSIVDEHKTLFSDENYLTLCNNLEDISKTIDGNLYQVEYLIIDVRTDLFLGHKLSTTINPRVKFEKRLCRLSPQQHTEMLDYMSRNDTFCASSPSEQRFLEKAGLPMLRENLITVVGKDGLVGKVVSPQLFITKVDKIYM